MSASWGDRPADAAPGRADVPAERWAACADRFGPPRAAHIGRAEGAALQARQAALVAANDRLLADVDALAAERDAWRRRAAYAEAANPSRLGAFAAGAVSTLVGLGAWVALGHLAAVLVRRLVGG